jgi:hypothetical protein
VRRRRRTFKKVNGTGEGMAKAAGVYGCYEIASKEDLLL